MGKGGNTARIIEEICGVIVGVGDRGDGEAYVTLFGPKWRVEAARVLVDAVLRGGGLVPPSPLERTWISHRLGLGVGTIRNL